MAEGAEAPAHSPTTLTMGEFREVDETDLGAGPWIRVDQDMIDDFADASRDHQWIHVDVEGPPRAPCT